MTIKYAKYLILPLCLLLGVMNFRAEGKKVIYVSSSQGNDNNDGSKDKPLRSMLSDKIPKSGVHIKLKCGDVFYENILLDGNDLSSYGNGEKPILSGWKIIEKGNAKWQEGKMVKGKWVAKKGTHVWRLDLLQSGFKGRNNSPETFENNIGLIMELGTKAMHGHKCEFLYKEDCNDPHKHVQRNTYLKNNFDFAQSSKYKEKAQPSDFRYLYMYLDHDPSKYGFRFSTYGHGIVVRNSTVNGVRVEGFSCHGVTCGSDASVSECEIDYVGGAQQLGHATWARFGNGVEFYISKIRKNGKIFNNKISHTFDCGATIQGSKHPGAYAENIVFENNIIRNCRQAFEFFLNNYDNAKGVNYDCIRCAFRNNICIDSGDNGFDSPEMRDTHILSYQKQYVSSIVIEGNLFIGGKGLYTAGNPELIQFGENEYYYVNPPMVWTSGKQENIVMYEERQTLPDSRLRISSVKFLKYKKADLEKTKKSYK